MSDLLICLSVNIEPNLALKVVSEAFIKLRNFGLKNNTASIIKCPTIRKAPRVQKIEFIALAEVFHL